jgi:hypothetical protein
MFNIYLKKAIRVVSTMALIFVLGFLSKNLQAAPSDGSTTTFWGVDFYRNYTSIPEDVIRLCHHFYSEWVDANNDGLMQPEERVNVAPNSHRLMLSNTGIAYVDPAKRAYWLARVQNIAQIVRFVPQGTDNTAGIDIDILDGPYDVEPNITTIGDLYGLEGPGPMDDGFDCGEHQDPTDPLYCRTSEGLPARTGEDFQPIAEYLGTLDLGGGFMLGVDDFTGLGALTNAGFIAVNSWTNPVPLLEGYFTAEIYFANLSCDEDYISDAKPVMPNLPKANCGADGKVDIMEDAVWMPSLTDFSQIHLVKNNDVDAFQNM